jgi:hypothetical protein
MITCPWCGTNYAAFQPNCKNCGGPLPPSNEGIAAAEELLMPPPAPRPIANNYIWRLLLTDAWAIAALVFLILGIVFAPLGLILTFLVVTAFIGVPFAAQGIIFLIGGGIVAGWRYKEMQGVVDVLRVGDAVIGEITSVEENAHVVVNGRIPWQIGYRFSYAGETYNGEVSTLNRPGASIQPGKQASILFLPQSPRKNSLYPHP